MTQHRVARIVKGIIFVCLGAAVFGVIVMALWNALIPDIFHGPSLTYWQAVGLLVLSHLLLRSGGWSGGWRGRHDWRKRFEARLASMTPEEREKLKEEWKKRCGYGE